MRRNEGTKQVASGGRQLVLLLLSLASRRFPLREILRTIRSARGNLRDLHEISQIWFEHIPHTLFFPPVSLHVVVAVLRLLQEEAFTERSTTQASLNAPG